MTDEALVQPARGTSYSHPGDELPPRLDVHASAALDRLTRWAAKALRAELAVITLAQADPVVRASHAGADAALASGRLQEFERQIAASGHTRAVGDARGDGDGPADAGERAVALVGAPLLDAAGDAVGSFCVMDARPRRWTIQDVELVNELTASAMTELELHAAREEAEREKRWSDRQRVVLELIAEQAPLARTLSELLDAAGTHAPGMLAAITRLERAPGRRPQLRVIAGRGLPRDFLSTLDGVRVVEGGSISGTAAFRCEAVVVADIARAELSPWFVELATGHGLHAGWSTPFLSRNGAVLGTFTIYYRTPRAPDERDHLVIDRSVHLARLAIEQVDSADALRRNATRARMLAREQTALQRVATRVADAPEPRILFTLVAEQVGRLLKADAGYVLRFEREHSHRNMGSWARDAARLLVDDVVAADPSDGISTQLRKGRGARRSIADAGHDALGFVHRIAAPVLVDGRAWGMVVALRDAREFHPDDEKRLARFAQLASVAVANAQAHEALATQALTDSLTGLANRRAFDERLAEETHRANRHGRALSVMLVDVDHFKRINDRFGHATGDRVLVNVADGLRSVMRHGDLLARIGGDEMAIILPDCPAAQATLVAQRMLDAAGADSTLARRHAVTLSAGVAGLLAGQSADGLLSCADQALYAAKDGGRNQVVSYDPDMPERVGLRLRA
jgi:diguanylate cyclase (GGDEF)-like protein